MTRAILLATALLLAVPAFRHSAAARVRDPEMYATFLQIRSEDCQARAKYQVDLVTDAQRPRDLAGMRRDAVSSCLKATQGLAENLATIIDPNGLDGDTMLDCVGRLKARHAGDAEPAMLILIIKSCVKHD